VKACIQDGNYRDTLFILPYCAEPVPPMSCTCKRARVHARNSHEHADDVGGDGDQEGVMNTRILEEVGTVVEDGVNTGELLPRLDEDTSEGRRRILFSPVRNRRTRPYPSLAGRKRGSRRNDSVACLFTSIVRRGARFEGLVGTNNVWSVVRKDRYIYIIRRDSQRQRPKRPCSRTVELLTAKEWMERGGPPRVPGCVHFLP